MLGLVLGMFVSFSEKSIVEAASSSISGPGTIYVGEQGYISINTNAPGGFFQSNISVKSGSTASINGKNTLLVDTGMDEKASPSGSYLIKGVSEGVTVFSVSVEGSDLNGNKFSDTKTITVTVKNRPPISRPNNENSSSQTGQGLDDGAYNSDLPKGESEEERKARELEERKKVPLIKNVKISSESNRLKGEVVSELNTEDSKFEYGFTLPRGVDAFKLDLTPLNDKVKLDYKQMYKLDAGHDKVDIIVKATDGEISQEFKFQVKKSAESKVAYSFGDRKYTLFNDEILNKNLKEYGFEYKKIENAKDAFDHYFEFNGNRFVLVVDDENNAKWLMIDEKKNVIDEVFIVSDKDKNVTVLVNEVLDEEDDRTYGGNRYEKLEVSLAKDFTDFGFDFVFNNEVYGWINDDNSLFTHAVLKKNNRRLVYLDHDGKSEVAYVAFDRNFDNPYLYGLIGFGILMTVGFISSLVVIRKRNKQINHLLNRRSTIEVQEVQ